MELFSNLDATANTMAILAIVYLMLIYWVRRPGRRDDQAEATPDQAMA